MPIWLNVYMTKPGLKRSTQLHTDMQDVLLVQVGVVLLLLLILLFVFALVLVRILISVRARAKQKSICARPR